MILWITGARWYASPVIIADEFEDSAGYRRGQIRRAKPITRRAMFPILMVANVVVSAGTEWTGSGNFSYGAGTIAGSGGGGIAAKCLTTFPSDFKFQFDYASAITNKMINFYFVNAAAAASFNAANASGGVGGAPAAGNGFLVQCANSGTKPNITDINSAGLYLGVNTANGQLYEVERIGATITLRQAGTIIHTFSMTDITEELTVIISTASQAGYSFNSNNVQWTTYSAAPALDVRSVGVTMASAPTSGFFVGKFSQSDPDTVYASSDGGVTWDTITLTDYGDFASGVSVFAGPVTLTGGGTDVRLRAVKASGTECRVEAWSGVFG
jgi:hypothetical protein